MSGNLVSICEWKGTIWFTFFTQYQIIAAINVKIKFEENIYAIAHMSCILPSSGLFSMKWEELHQSLVEIFYCTQKIGLQSRRPTFHHLCGEKLKFLAKKGKFVLKISCAPTPCDKWKHARCQEKGKYGIDTSRVPDKHHLSPCNSLSGTSECFSTQRQEHKPDSRWNVHQQQCLKMENMDLILCGCQNTTICLLSIVCLDLQMLNWILHKIDKWLKLR